MSQEDGPGAGVFNNGRLQTARATEKPKTISDATLSETARRQWG